MTIHELYSVKCLQLTLHAPLCFSTQMLLVHFLSYNVKHEFKFDEHHCFLV